MVVCMYIVLMLLTGIEVHTSDGDVTCHAILLQVSADLPARACIANMKQFNGAFGCLYCESRGSTAPGNSLHRFWPIDHAAPLRTHSMVLESAREATTSASAVSQCICLPNF